MKRTIVEAIASRLQAWENCQYPWRRIHTEKIEELVKEFLPSGAGCDNGTQFDFCKSTPERLILYVDFHHMSEGGMYDGWTHHTIVVRPSFVYKVDIQIGGKDRNGVKEYLDDTMRIALTQEIEWEQG